ncbi:hypothetical protein HJ590_17710 [Naumannella sp. ID2617S]|nr:hypothetical protein [Naumannella sp. ID2617S]
MTNPDTRADFWSEFSTLDAPPPMAPAPTAPQPTGHYRDPVSTSTEAPVDPSVPSPGTGTFDVPPASPVPGDQPADAPMETGTEAQGLQGSAGGTSEGGTPSEQVAGGASDRSSEAEVGREGANAEVANPAQSEPGKAGEAGGAEVGRVGEGGRQDPVIEVPKDHQELTKDGTVADEKVATLPDGGVINTTGKDTVITTRDGVQVTRHADGTVSVDASIRNNSDPKAGDDVSELHGDGTFMTEDGTKVQVDDGKVIVTQLDGTRMTMLPNGTVEVDLPHKDDKSNNPDDPGAGDGKGEDDKGKDEDKGKEDDKGKDDEKKEDEGAGDPSGGGGSPSGGGGSPSGGGGSPSGGGGSPSGGGGSPSGGGGGNNQPTENPPGDTEAPKDTKPPGPAEDTEFNVADLRSDAGTYSDRANKAKGISQTFTGFDGAIPAWGVWYQAEGPYKEAVKRCVTIFNDAEKALDKMSDKLNQTATDYEKTEEKNKGRARKKGK